MMSTDCLLLDAKKAILEDQLHRWRTLHQAGHREQATRQCQATLACATDLLNEALRILESVLQEKKRSTQPRPPAPGAPSTA
jgi:hypothetical protein